MAKSETTRTVATRFAFSAEADGYVLSLVAEGSGTPVLQVTLGETQVEEPVLKHAAVALELRPNGAVVAYNDRGGTSDLAAIPLSQLVTEALSVLDVQDAEHLADLESMVRAALQAIQDARAKLTSSR